MPHLRHRLGSTYYEIKGRSKRQTPCLFLHGGPGGHSEDLRRLWPLADERPIIIYDQLGSGFSKAKKDTRWTVALFVEELRILIDRLGIQAFHLGGGSWGATLALEYYLRTRDRRIQSLTFRSPLFSSRVWKKDTQALLRKIPAKAQHVIRVCESVGATDSAVYRRAEHEFVKRFVDRSKKPSKPSRRPWNREIYQTMWGPSEFCPVGTLKNYDRVSDLKNIKVPTHLLCGQYDEATPASCKMFQRKIQRSQLTVLKGCSHRSLVENTPLVLRTLRAWLRSVDQKES